MADDKVAKALKRFKLAAAAEAPQRLREKDDLGWQTPEGQWPAEVRAAREATTVGNIPIPARPMLSIAGITEPIDLVTNQQRAAHLECYFHPLSEEATDDTAEVLQGLYRSGGKFGAAALARNWAYDRSLWCGRGWYRLETVYDAEGGHPFDQKIVWKKILYQGAVYVDPYATEPCEWMWAFVVEDVPFDRYKQLYPDSTLSGYGDGELTSIGDEAPDWIGGDDEVSRTVRVAEYWRVELTKRTHVLLDDGSVAPEDEIPEGRKKVTGEKARSRDEEIRTLYWSKINCHEELEPEQDRDGKYIPLIPVIGHELQPIEGKRRWNGMIANAKDGARLTNYAASGAVELAALEPRAPFQLDPKQIETFEQFWQQSNTRNFPFLPSHKMRDGIQYDKPERTQIDVGRLGPNMTLLSMGRDFVQSAMATYDPALGKQPTAHRSGKALEALQGQTVEATSGYLDNFANFSLMYEAQVWLDLAPHVYDRPGRVVKILDGEDKASSVMVNQPFTTDPNTKQPVPVNLPPGAAPHVAADGRNPVKHFDLKKGSYGITTTIGKSAASRLQQGSEEIGGILQADPALMPVIGPLYFKYRDFPGARQIADLLKKVRDHAMPWLRDEGEQGPQDLAAMQQQLQKVTADAQQMQQLLQTDGVKIQGQIQMKQMDLEFQKWKVQVESETKIAVAELGAKVDRLSLFLEERSRLGTEQHEATQADLDRQHEAQQGQLAAAHEVGASEMEHGQATAQADQAHQQATAQADQQHAQAMMQQEHAQSGDQQLAATQAALAPEPAGAE